MVLDNAADTSPRDQSRAPQMRKVEGKSGSSHAQPLGYGPRAQAVGTRLYQQADDREPGFVPERGEHFRCMTRFHASNASEVSRLRAIDSAPQTHIHHIDSMQNPHVTTEPF